MPFVFLANTAPAIQSAVLSQLSAPRLVVADTMNLWIDSTRAALLEVLHKVDGLLVNDEEARSLSGTRNLVAAGKKLLSMGPQFVIVKKGEHGAFLFAKDRQLRAAVVSARGRARSDGRRRFVRGRPARRAGGVGRDGDRPTSCAPWSTAR